MLSFSTGGGKTAGGMLVKGVTRSLNGSSGGLSICHFVCPFKCIATTSFREFLLKKKNKTQGLVVISYCDHHH